MIIRKATHMEIEKIMSHAKVVIKDSTYGHVEPNQNAVEAAKNMIAEVLHDGGYYLVCEENRMILGWVGVAPTYNPFMHNWNGMITELYVLPSYRQRGIGKMLLIKAIEQIKVAGFKRVQLNVYAGNPAKQLYEHLGFRDISTIMEMDL